MSEQAAADKLLIVNADDLGRTEGINEGIFAAHERGIVSSATVMVAYPAATTALARWADYPRLGLGLHVALSGGPPLLPPERLPSLVDSAGLLPRRPELIGDADPSEVRAEVAAQYQRFCALAGRRPTHLDGHHHCHRLPLVAAPVIDIACREGLPVRNAGGSLGSLLRQAAVPSSDVFDDSYYGEQVELSDLLAILDRLESGVTELMCHPAQVDEELRRGSTYVEEREVELATLTHPEARRALQRVGARLINFTELAR